MPVAYVVSLNLHRRHLNESQRAMVAARIANLPAHRPPDRKSANLPGFEAAPDISQAKAAEMLNVARSSVQRAATVRESGAPELIAAAEQGRVAVSTAAHVRDGNKSVADRALIKAGDPGFGLSIIYLN